MACGAGCCAAAGAAVVTGSKRHTRTSVYHLPLNSLEEMSICALMSCPGTMLWISLIWFVQQVRHTVFGYCSSVSMMRSCLRHGPLALVPSVRPPSLTTFPVISIYDVFIRFRCKDKSQILENVHFVEDSSNLFHKTLTAFWLSLFKYNQYYVKLIVEN